MSSEWTRLWRDNSQLVRRYLEDFAWQLRSTRDVAALRTMVQRSDEILGRLEGLTAGREKAELLPSAKVYLALFRRELLAVEEAVRLGATFDAFASLASLANALMACYGRRFCDRPRLLCDSVLLETIVDALVSIESAMRECVVHHEPSSLLHQDVTTISRAIAQLRSEADNMVRAHQIGDPTARLMACMHRLEEQQQAFVGRVKGRPRGLVRPALVACIIRSVERTAELMEGLRREGLENPLLDNVAAARHNVEVYRRELAEVERARAALWPAVLVKSLCDSAQNHIKRYELEFLGRHPLDVNAWVMDGLCNEMHEIVLQLAEIRPELRDEAYHQAFGTTLIWLTRMESAHAEMRDARETARG
jgi:hypothetical protein